MQDTKLQRRPRSRRLRFSNDEMLILESVSPIQLIADAPSGFFFELREVRLVANIVAVYTNIAIPSKNPLILIFTGMGQAGFIEDTEGPGVAAIQITNLLGNTTGLNSVMTSNTGLQTEATFSDADAFASQDILGTSGIFLEFFNNNADLMDGHPANYMDVLIDYNILSVQPNRID